LLEALSEAERARLSPALRQTQLRQNEELLEAGEPIQAVWFPHDAVTSTIVDSAEGTTIEVGLMGLEGMVGLSLLLGKSISSTTVIAQIPGTATCMSADDFRRLVIGERGELFELLLAYTDNFLAMVAQTAACNSMHSVDERLARWILMCHDRVGRDDMPLTQEFLAYMLGVRRPSVSLAASGLQQVGLIQYGRGNLTVMDRFGLEERACACYGIVRSIAEGVYGVKRNVQPRRA
jgi:CRP-like cAMP-binding protein